MRGKKLSETLLWFFGTIVESVPKKKSFGTPTNMVPINHRRGGLYFFPHFCLWERKLMYTSRLSKFEGCPTNQICCLITAQVFRDSGVMQAVDTWWIFTGKIFILISFVFANLILNGFYPNLCLGCVKTTYPSEPGANAALSTTAFGHHFKQVSLI